MGKETREQMNANYKKKGLPLPYPGDKVAGEAEPEEISKTKKKVN